MTLLAAMTFAIAIISGITRFLWSICYGLVSVGSNDRSLLSATYDNLAVKAAVSAWFFLALIGTLLTYLTGTWFGWIGTPVGEHSILDIEVTGKLMDRLSRLSVVLLGLLTLLVGWILNQVNVHMGTPFIAKQNGQNLLK